LGEDSGGGDEGDDGGGDDDNDGGRKDNNGGGKDNEDNGKSEGVMDDETGIPKLGDVEVDEYNSLFPLGVKDNEAHLPSSFFLSLDGNTFLDGCAGEGW